MLTSLAFGSPVRNASIFPGWYPGQSNASQSSETRRRIEAEFDRHPSGPYCSRTAAPARSETSISARMASPLQVSGDGAPRSAVAPAA